MLPTTICAVCGVSCASNQANTCANCLQTEHDITAGLAKNGVLLKCKACERYQRGTGIGWVPCENESKELLALCLKKVKGLKNVSLVDACFIWTEPHSKRIKVKLRVQKEVVNGIVLKQGCIVEFVVQNRMCEDCHKTESNQTWNSVVQVRQQVNHKRTFLFLEQLIIKHREYERTIKIDPKPFGVDFYFAARNDAVRFTDFLEAVVPAKCKKSKKLISADIKSNSAVYNHTFCVDLVPVCRDDFVCLPLQTAQKLGNISQLVICLHVSSSVRFIDPVTCQICEMTTEKYWQNPFRAFASAQDLTEFTVLDVQSVNDDNLMRKGQREEMRSFRKKKSKKRRRAQLAASECGGNNIAPIGATISSQHTLVFVEVARTSDFGVNDKRFSVYSHLGRVLKPGDAVLGYDMCRLNINGADTKDLKREIPDVVLVRKHYPMWRKSQKRRAWKLKSLAAEAPNEPGASMGASRDTNERDHELFMRDIEEDQDMRQQINLYKDDTFKEGDQAIDQVEDDAPRMNLEDLLHDMTITAPGMDSPDKEEDDDSLL